MIILLVLPVLLAASAAALPDKVTTTAIPDLSDVRAVAISGEASSINITTRSDQPYGASLGGRRKGWFSSWYSSWYFADCRDNSDMRVDGTVLHVDIAASSWLDPSDCVIELNANVPAGAALRVDQSAFTARLIGHFSELGIAGKAADVTLDGHASGIDIRADALKASLDFDKVEANENVSIRARALDAYLGFGNNVPVDYKVTAQASWVDARQPSVWGAKPHVEIDGDFVRVRIR
ncbi:hypothetical protein [Rhizobium mesosinicum]|uniref:Auto-transporter adhesin head GIN domain-containing protein n=1 Tax=Rhizobium mesosinicum TaxID=335017 RepID=A0ABS7GVP6_9HYPH|nr:hypothetical protein [Rhizobium mesosinicum]MBW9053882.1 hypothetical protein [Rhizobium mesosinicum]